MAIAMRVFDVLACPRIRILLRQPEVNHIHAVAGRRPRGRVDVRAHKEVRRLDVAMHPITGVNELYEGQLYECQFSTN